MGNCSSSDSLESGFIRFIGGESSTELPEHSKSEPASSNDLDLADNKLFLVLGGVRGVLEGADFIGFGSARDLGLGMTIDFEGGVLGGVRGVVGGVRGVFGVDLPHVLLQGMIGLGVGTGSVITG